MIILPAYLAYPVMVTYHLGYWLCVVVRLDSTSVISDHWSCISITQGIRTTIGSICT